MPLVHAACVGGPQHWPPNFACGCRSCCLRYERARVIYKFGIDTLPREASIELHKEYVSFEKQHGDQKGKLTCREMLLVPS